MKIIDVAIEKMRREQFVIALASSIRAMMQDDPEDPTEIREDLITCAKELAADTPEMLTEHYLFACSEYVARNDPMNAEKNEYTLPVLEDHPGPYQAELHAAALAYVRTIERDFGIHLLDLGGAQ
ncbi:hypothetical protein [Beijerinckia indica]|uniref:Uncharacterized protein n=1 Tax=Beijerinckia indica subsp. indica (strain ATCC 9039 / DSM 1715 / NCIMB 8712) TaxID=395963 RepID=B2ICC8_BEII9|nr:hypothetical protein [Beijerinckia indica]ACB96725.1 hypothetical protein Bind_3164 [Beijerinckia indica subsp. indica ATCC 9039]